MTALGKLLGVLAYLMALRAFELWENAPSDPIKNIDSDNKENSDGYDKSSVLSYIEGIPDEPNRLLIFHGMIGMCFILDSGSKFLSSKGEPAIFPTKNLIKHM